MSETTAPENGKIESMERLMRLDPSMPLGDALDTLAEMGGARQVTKVTERDDGPVLGAVVLLRGDHTDRYLAAIEAVDNDQEQEAES